LREELFFNSLLLAYFLQIIIIRLFGGDFGRNILITDNGGGGWYRPISGNNKIGIASAENTAELVLYKHSEEPFRRRDGSNFLRKKSLLPRQLAQICRKFR